MGGMGELSLRMIAVMTKTGHKVCVCGDIVFCILHIVTKLSVTL